MRLKRKVIIAWKDFQKRHGVELSLERYNSIMAEEERSKRVESARKQSGSLEGSAVEESNAKCNYCSSGLSVVDIMLYGNRCIFCAEGIKNLNPITYLAYCILDYQIDKALANLISKLGYSDARFLYMGCLAELGYSDINQVRVIRTKTYLKKRLYHYVKKGVRA